MKTKEYRFPFHGLEREFRAVLLAPDKLFDGPDAPFCVTQLIGQFIERLDDAFAVPRAVASLHIPVRSRGQDLWVHMDLEWQVELREKGTYDEDGDAVLRLDQCRDGAIRIAKYDGPTRWRTEDWGRLTMALAAKEPIKGPAGPET